eukprot:jgi/Mesvir1/1580/Mv14549-RA.1
MVDSGLTGELITPHLRSTLGLAVDLNGKKVSGLGAGGAVAQGDIIPLTGASLCCGTFAQPGARELPLPQLTAVVTDFPQEHLDPDHDPVEGMLGMELLSMFDTDLDFPKDRLRFWVPGQGVEAAAADGLIEVPAAVLNETGLLGIRVTAPAVSAAGARGRPDGTTSIQPLVGILDCGASFSAVNWAAAALLGLPPKGDKSWDKAPKLFSVGVDGRPLPLPTHPLQLSYVGDAVRDPAGGRDLTFKLPPPGWKPWDTVQVAVADLPVFSQLLGDGTRPYLGPAALVGLDVLSQRRVVLATGSGKTRARKLYTTLS